MSLDSLTLKTRLIFAVAIPCIALILVAVTSLSSMSTMQSEASALYLAVAGAECNTVIELKSEHHAA
jgi:hypothetical protein